MRLDQYGWWDVLFALQAILKISLFLIFFAVCGSLILIAFFAIGSFIFAALSFLIPVPN